MIDRCIPYRVPGRRGSILIKMLLWGGLTVLLLLGVLLSIYQFYGWRARLSLEKKVAALIAVGEPMTIALLEPARVDGSINADADVRAAIALLPGKTEAYTKFNQLADDPQIPLREDERALMKGYLAEHADALAALRGVLDKPRAVSQVKLSSPLISVMLPQLNPMRELANACANTAYIRYDEGRHDLALDALRPIEPMSRVCGTGPTLVNCLVAVGMRGLVASRLIEMAPDLKIGSEPGDVTPDRLRELIRQMIDSSHTQDELRVALQGERLMQLDTLINLAEGTLSIAQVVGPGAPGAGTGSMGNSMLSFMSRPIIYSNASDCIETMGEYLTAIPSPDVPAARKVLGPIEVKLTKNAGRYTNAFSSILIPSLTRAAVTHFRVRTDQNLAATALAIRWYQVDHNGALPATLEALVPNYLPEVPVDYISGKPIRYRGEGGQPMIWSVGDNEVDDDGSSAPMNPKRELSGAYARWQMKDAVVFLKRQPRPATQPVE